jgi:hypothetical protein
VTTGTTGTTGSTGIPTTGTPTTGVHTTEAAFIETESSSSDDTALLIGIGVGCGALVMICLIIGLVLFRRKQRKQNTETGKQNLDVNLSPVYSTLRKPPEEVSSSNAYGSMWTRSSQVTPPDDVKKQDKSNTRNCLMLDMYNSSVQ